MRLKRILALVISSVLAYSSPIHAGPVSDRINERKNIAPTASFDVIKKSPVDIVVLTDYEGQKLVDLKSKFTDLKIGLSKNADVRVNYIDNTSPKVSVGSKMEAVPYDYYGISVGVTYTYDYSKDSSSGSSHRYDVTETGSFTLDGITRLPWESPLSPYNVNINPSSVQMTPYNETSGYSSQNFRRYSFPGHTGAFELFVSGSYNSPDYYSSTSYSIKAGPTFSIADQWKYLNSGTTGKTYNADVRGWDINSCLNAMSLRQNASTIVLFACEKTDKDFYSYGSYNYDNIKNYKLGNLRAENLGSFIQGKSAMVYSISGNTVDSFSLAGYMDSYLDQDDTSSTYNQWISYYYDCWARDYQSTNASTRQNKSIKDMITQYAAKGQAFGAGDIDLALRSITYNVGTPANKVDLVVASNNGNEANDLVNHFKARVSGTVDVQSTVMDGSNAAYTDTVYERKLGNLKRYMPHPEGNTAFGLTKSGELYQDYYNASITLFTNVKDITYFGYMEDYQDDNGDNQTRYIGTLVALRNDGTVWYYGNTSTYPNAIFSSRVEDSGSWSRIGYFSNIKEIGGNSTLLLALKNDGTLLKKTGTGANAVVQDYNVEQVMSTYYRYSNNDIRVMVNGNSVYTGENASGIKETKNGTCLLSNDRLIVYNWMGQKTAYDNVRTVLYYNIGSTYAMTLTNGDLLYYETTNSNYHSSPNGIIESGYTSWTSRIHGSLKNVSAYATRKLSDYYYSGFEQIFKYSDGTMSNDSGMNEDLFVDPVSGGIYSGGGAVLLRRDGIATSYSNRVWLEYNFQPTDPNKICTYTPFHIYGFNTDVLHHFNFRSDAEKYFIYISSSTGTDWKYGFNSNFPFNTLDDSFINKLRSNGGMVYVAAPEQAMDLLLRWPNVTYNRQTRTLRELYNSLPVEHNRFNSWWEISDYLYARYGALIGKEPNSVYLLYGEDSLAYSVNYEDFESDPRYDLRWKFDHNAYYYENSLGVEANSGIWQNSEKDSFTKVGLYTMVCQARDNPKNDDRFDAYRLWGEVSPVTKIYVHRRPVADFQIVLRKSGDGYSTITVDTSYDLDAISQANRGITSWRWKYRVSGTLEWYSGQIPGWLPKNMSYDVSLEVLDRQGAWSFPKIVTVDTNTVNLIPYVDANPQSVEWTNQNITVTVTADDNGENDFNRVSYTSTQQIVEPGWYDGTVYQKSFPLTYTTEGSWYLHMRVWDNAGNTFYRYRGPYKLDKTPPGGTATPYSQAWTNQNVSVNFAPWDALSGVNYWRYTTSDNDGASYGAWSGYAWGPAAANINFNYQGRHRIVAEVVDYAGNVSYVASGSYLIDKEAPVITANPSAIPENIGPIIVNVAVTDNLSGVRETKYCWTQSEDKPLSGWQSTASSSFPTVQDQEGTWYLHLESWDNAGNSSYSCLGSYTVIYIEMYDFTVTMIQDTAWRDYYFSGIDINGDGAVDSYQQRTGTDIKTASMPINYNLNGYRPVSYPVESVKAGVKVKFYIKARGGPDTLVMRPRYLMENGYGTYTEDVLPVSKAGEFWDFEWIIPLEVRQDSFVCFDVLATKNGKQYGNSYWKDVWQAGNTSNAVFYVLGNALKDLKFNQSH